jgi:hypothetical protein
VSDPKYLVPLRAVMGRVPEIAVFCHEKHENAKDTKPRDLFRAFHVFRAFRGVVWDADRW